MRFAVYRPVWNEMAPTTFDFYPYFVPTAQGNRKPYKK